MGNIKIIYKFFNNTILFPVNLTLLKNTTLYTFLFRRQRDFSHENTKILLGKQSKPLKFVLTLWDLNP